MTLLSFAIILEVIRAYEILYSLHPYVGYIFIGLLIALTVYLIYQIKPLFNFRSAPTPPNFSKDKPLSNKQIKHYEIYLNSVNIRLQKNELLQKTHNAGLMELKDNLALLSKLSANRTKFFDKFEQIEVDYIEPLVVQLDKKAEAVVGDNVGLITIGTALSPYRSLDVYIVLVRNFRMVNQIIKIYRTSPTFLETIKVFYDIIKIVAAVNIINAMDNIWTGIGRHIPLVGNYGEAISEGLFSGLLTSVTGHAAIDRCRTYKPLSYEETALKFRGKLKNWAWDVLDIIKRHAFDKIIPNWKWSKKGNDSDVENEKTFWDTVAKVLKSPLPKKWKE